MNLEHNKIAAAILLAGLIAMLAGLLAKLLYAGPGAEHHASGHEEKRGFRIEIAEAIANEGEKKEEINIPLLLSKGDAAAGEKVAKVCMTCHTFEKGGANKVGPNLYGVLGGKSAHIAGFQYSKVMTEYGKNWEVSNIWEFLHAPQKYMKGTKMSFAGVKKPEDLANLITYMNKMSDKPVAFPKP